MKKKKLTDEQIIEAFEHCVYKARDKGCWGCAYARSKGKDDITCSMLQMRRDTLDLIHRLQKQNEKLREAKTIYATVDYCADDLAKALTTIDKQKAEIERLTKKCQAAYAAGYEQGKFDSQRKTEE